MKACVSFGFAVVVMMSMSQLTMADVNNEKVVRSDRVSFYQPKAVKVTQTQRVQRSDRIAFNLPEMEQPMLQKKRIMRNDRVVINKM